MDAQTYFIDACYNVVYFGCLFVELCMIKWLSVGFLVVYVSFMLLHLAVD